MPPPQLPVTPPCMEWNPRIPNPFGYHPSLAPGIVFTILFIASTAMHAWQTYHYRKLWLLFFVLGALGEVSGWVSRTVAFRCAYSVKVFEAQLASLIMAPAFTTAGIYAILAFMIPILGYHTSPLRPRMYLIIFMLVDFFSLLLQAIGGGMAGAAFSRKEDTTTATTIMVSGIIFQLGSTCIFTTLFEFVMLRGIKTLRKNRPLLILASATMLTVTCMVIRGVYRSMELLQGWRGYLATGERFALSLEGSLMAIAIINFNFFNPVRLLAEAHDVANRQQHEQMALQGMSSSSKDKLQEPQVDFQDVTADRRTGTAMD